jgi:hypothetical protein
VLDLEEKLQEVHEVVRMHSHKQHVKQKIQYNRRTSKVRLEVGDFVWLNNPSKKIGLSPKLMTFWEEVPYEIIEKISEVTYRVKNLGNKREKMYTVTG